MAKFAVDLSPRKKISPKRFFLERKDDGDGPSSMKDPKRRRFLSSGTDRLKGGDSQVEEGEEEGEEGKEENGEEEFQEEEEEEEEEEDDDDDEEQGEEEDEDGKEEKEDNDEEGDSSTSRKGGSFDVTLTDPDVLDCTVCLDPLTSPVFQCLNGHIACSSCCRKIRNKCPSCSKSFGYIRCRAIEKVLESVKLACQNAKYGCKYKFLYHEKNAHEKICIFVPYSCPFPSCSHLGSFRKLVRHLSFEHRISRTPIKFDLPASFLIDGETDVHLLEEVEEGTVFVPRNEKIISGNKIKISCVDPSADAEYLYDIIAESLESSLELRTLVKRIEGPANSMPYFLEELPYLLVPRGFFDDAGGLNLKVSTSRRE